MSSRIPSAQSRPEFVSGNTPPDKRAVMHDKNGFHSLLNTKTPVDSSIGVFLCAYFFAYRSPFLYFELNTLCLEGVFFI